MIAKSPCLKCEIRYPACQSHCELGQEHFKRQQEEFDRIKVAREKEKSVTRSTVEGIVRSKKRARR